MKKPVLKLARKKKQVEAPTRITNKTVAEHREQIIAKARRFKYPIQYTKHRLVINVSLLGLAIIAAFLTFSWWQLYKVQTTSDFFYRIVRLVPVPVASVDGEMVKYGDYLLNYKGSETYLTAIEKVNNNTYANGNNSKSQYDFYKAQAMHNAVAEAYAQKLARQRNITITDEQVEDVITRTRKTSSSQGEISQEAYDRATEQYYGYSPAEYRYYLRKRLLRQAVAYEIDAAARNAADVVGSEVAKNPQQPFDAVLATVQKKHPTVQLLASGWVKKDNKDGGLAAAAAKLEKGQVSGIIKSLKGDGYYLVRLLDTNKDGEVSYEFIRIPLTEFDRQLTKLRKDNKIKHYIVVPDTRPQIKQ